MLQQTRLTRAERKAARRSPEPGFTPVPNKRIDAALAVAHIRAKLANPMLSELEAIEQGWRYVAATLSPPSRSRVASIQRKIAGGSKSDSPAYRKGIWPASKVASPST